MRTKVIAVVVVMLIVATSVVAVACHGGSSFAYSPGAYPDTHLTVLGNADSDEDIDSDDVALIRSYVESEARSEYREVYMYDADYNGVIDSEDVALVERIVDALASGDWSAVGVVHYVNVDKDIAAYDMTKSDKVVTLIAPPLDSVLAMGGKDLVVGFDSRITTGKYHSEYARTFDFSKMTDVGDCNEPSAEAIAKVAKANGGVNVVCGTKDSYGPTLESVFAGSDVQVIRIASWEYGGTMYGFMTLAFLLKLTAGAKAYCEKYYECAELVEKIVSTVDPSKRAAGNVGAAAVYGYSDELSLLGNYCAEYSNLMTLDPYDSAEAFLQGKNSGGHGDTITSEAVVAMYQKYNLRNLAIMIGSPFQVYAASGDAQASAANFASLYAGWCTKIGAETMSGLNVCITGYSFSSGVSEVLNRLIHCYWLYNDEFLAYLGVTTQREAQDFIADYVDWYCEAIGIGDLWSFYGEANGGKAGTLGMNLLYCGEGSPLNIMYGSVSGSIDVGRL